MHQIGFSFLLLVWYHFINYLKDRELETVREAVKFFSQQERTIYISNQFFETYYLIEMAFKGTVDT